MNITRQDIFEVGYMTYLGVYEHFDEVARELDKLYLHPGMPDDKKEAVLQLSARASSLDPADRHSVARLIGDLDALTSWIMSLPLDSEVQS
nr:MAG TPA: Serine/Threonine protein kinase [Caudoviricetes sp.]